jgi:hypothetical protein
MCYCVRAVIAAVKVHSADVTKLAHVEWLKIIGKIVPLRGVVGRKKGIEKASKAALEYEPDIAYSDLVVEAARSWVP